MAINDRRYRAGLFPVPRSLMPRRSGVPVAINDRRYRAGLFPVPRSLIPRRSGVPVAINDRRYRAGLFPVPRSLFPWADVGIGPYGCSLLPIKKPCFILGIML